MVNLIFVFDEFSDVATDATAQYLAHIMKDALRNPHKPRPEDEHVLGEVTHQCVPLLFDSSLPLDPYTDLLRDSRPRLLNAPP